MSTDSGGEPGIRPFGFWNKLKLKNEGNVPNIGTNYLKLFF
jgi:hypothetical protein